MHELFWFCGHSGVCNQKIYWKRFYNVNIRKSSYCQGLDDTADSIPQFPSKSFPLGTKREFQRHLHQFAKCASLPTARRGTFHLQKNRNVLDHATIHNCNQVTQPIASDVVVKPMHILLAS